MKTMLTIHKYLSCLFAPMLLFFAITGAWQVLGLHQKRKNESYTPPAAIELMSKVHMNKRYIGRPLVLYQAFVLSMSAGLVLTTVLGMIVAFRLTRGRWLAGVFVFCGVAILAYLVAVARQADAPQPQPPQTQSAGSSF